jgi:hypothetical protein
MYFGLGLVKTQEDFGVRGEPPSNPALLDWLATEFIRTGWDVRAMQRLIVTSGHLSAVVEGDAGHCSKGTREPPAARGPARKTACRDDP